MTFFSADRPGGQRVPADPRGPDLCAEHPADRHGAAPGEGSGEEAAAGPRGRGQEPGDPQRNAALSLTPRLINCVWEGNRGYSSNSEFGGCKTKVFLPGSAEIHEMCFMGSCFGVQAT